LPEALDDFGYIGAITLTLADVDVFNDSVAPNHEGCGTRDVDRVFSERVMNAVSFGDDAFLVEQEREGQRMFSQVFPGLEETAVLFGGDENRAAELVDLVFVWLELGHALHAVRSPGATQELQHCGTFLQNVGEGKAVGAISCSEREVGCAIADIESVRTSHLSRL
jgi:hypothetical protein